jgi:hypothetical protein
MERLVPDAVRRHEVEAEMVEVPLGLYELPFDVPSNWWKGPCSYLLLSEAYRRDADESRALGWPVVECIGGHLDLVNTPEQIAELLIDSTP